MVDVAYTATAVAQSYLMQQQNASPADGATVSITNDDKDRTLNLTPAGALATLSIGFPSDASSRIGQLVCITSSQGVALLALVGGATVTGFVAALAANDFLVYQKRAANTWIRRS